jgi:hypothetical protein
MLELFDLVDVGAVVEITYQPVMLARYGDGTVFLEVHPDPYRLSGRPEAQVRDLLRTVRQAIQERAGRAVLISP